MSGLCRQQAQQCAAALLHSMAHSLPHTPHSAVLSPHHAHQEQGAGNNRHVHTAAGGGGVCVPVLHTAHHRRVSQDKGADNRLHTQQPKGTVNTCRAEQIHEGQHQRREPVHQRREHQRRAGHRDAADLEHAF